jgi:adenosylcobinamide-phosphate synthase
MNVYRALAESENLDAARTEVARIVGRDTAHLDRQGICRACVETVAENLVDGITSPIFFAVLASLLPAGDWLAPVSLAVLGAYGYKAINTMDSMYGYKNVRYLNFGRRAALVDDGANFLPARLSGLLLVVAAWLLRLNGAGAMNMFFRDRLKHASPNGGHPEAAVAGSLDIQLGGDSSYFGEIVSKPTLGEPIRPLKPEDIVATNHLMFVTTGLFCSILLLGRILLTGV